MDLLELNRLAVRYHDATQQKPWYANPGTAANLVVERLNTLAPLYATVSGSGFGNLTGDALEVIVFKCLEQIYESNCRFAYQGQFRLDAPKEGGRYRKTQPPKNIGRQSAQKEADFYQFGHDAGPLCIECKNYREWTYPHHDIIKELIVKATDLNAVPVLIARRMHYTTRTNLLEPAGIIAHESYFQYYPADQAELAKQVKHKRSLGFTDVTASEEPHVRTLTFFRDHLPQIADRMANKWYTNIDALREGRRSPRSIQSMIARSSSVSRIQRIVARCSAMRRHGFASATFAQRPPLLRRAAFLLRRLLAALGTLD
jgi:hypothetical protein